MKSIFKIIFANMIAGLVVVLIPYTGAARDVNPNRYEKYIEKLTDISSAHFDYGWGMIEGTITQAGIVNKLKFVKVVNAKYPDINAELFIVEDAIYRGVTAFEKLKVGNDVSVAYAWFTSRHHNVTYNFADRIDVHLKAKTVAAVVRQPQLKSRLTQAPFSITDSQTGLIWARDANLVGRRIDYRDALAFIEQLNYNKFAGCSDWRLPTLAEFELLVSYAKEQDANHAVDSFLVKQGFVNVQSNTAYWTSTDYTISIPGDGAMAMQLSNGVKWKLGKLGSLWVLPVCGPAK